MCSLYWSAASWHNSRTVAVATPRPATSRADAVPEHGRTILEVAQVEQAEHRAVFVDQDVEYAGTSLVFCQQPVVGLIEAVENSSPRSEIKRAK